MTLHFDELPLLHKAHLIEVIAKSTSDKAPEMALLLLRDIPALNPDYRNALLGLIVSSRDKTTCSLALTLIPDLGEWASKLDAVLAS